MSAVYSAVNKANYLKVYQIMLHSLQVFAYSVLHTRGLPQNGKE